jgi:hypothetical protein
LTAIHPRGSLFRALDERPFFDIVKQQKIWGAAVSSPWEGRRY